MPHEQLAHELRAVDRGAPDPHAPYVREQAPNWEVEPLRWAGIRYVQNAYLRTDVADAARQRPPPDAGLAQYLGEP